MISVLDGSTFLVCDDLGDVIQTREQVTGLFFRDTRHLSRWELRLNGRRLAELSHHRIAYDEVAFFLYRPTGTPYSDSSVSIRRHRFVGAGMREELVVTNVAGGAAHLEISLLFGADFADIFEVKDGLPKAATPTTAVGAGRATLRYEHEGFRRATTISAKSARFSEGMLSFTVTLAPQESWRAEIDVTVSTGTVRHPLKQRRGSPNMAAELDEWLAAAPRLTASWDDLRHIYRQSLLDLAALRFYPREPVHGSLPAAGLPWFMALFGRDALITSLQALPYCPELARTTLLALAHLQATDSDDFRDADPGKIPHELRHGELTHRGLRPQSPYYGAADTTTLFLIVLDEYERWSGDAGFVRLLEPAARAALGWIADYADSDGDGYIDYRTRNPGSGLANQCWKDSWDSVVHPDGRLARLPRATCELQGYAYDARLRAARLARAFWDDPGLADRLEAEAGRLKERFDRDYWLPDDGWYALALDGGNRPVPTLTSNIGHLLFSGIVTEERASSVARHLLGDRLFSGWGVRTLAAGQGAYNPIGYHVGTVWPHDNALIAAGLARYGHHEEAGRIALAMLQAAPYFDHRLPEAFAGYPRDATGCPVRYPTACSPQAWSAGTPLMLVRVLLDMEPDGERLTSAPRLPRPLGDIAVSGVPGRWGRADVHGAAP
ncbi:amylo-alpha-1,6-glucosidase [Microtetraspora niveoalba]|uniref:amylo-alpha-1,6-glucosidase n=1 Tax=Microtetraspora niveoalba TaxID=46175 RepID=UPI00082F0076|nr:glycogen debranching N-terminal domain-containing protein [Microtetraspora niveoalba]